MIRQVGHAAASKPMAVYEGDLDRASLDSTFDREAVDEGDGVAVAVDRGHRSDRFELGQRAVTADVTAVKYLIDIFERTVQRRNDAVVRVRDDPDLQSGAQRIDFPMADRMSSMPRIPVLFRSSRMGFVSTQSMLIISCVSLMSSRARCPSR